MGSGKTIGLILLVAGAAIFLIVLLFLGTGVASDQLTLAGAVLGIALFGVLPALLFGGIGAFLFSRGRAEERELVDIRKKERLLGLIQAQGKVSLGSVMIEMKMSREEVTNAIYDLVNQGLFSGYINWQETTFYSADAAKVGSTTCPNCGGTREVAGKGVVRCPYCGVELFIPR